MGASLCLYSETQATETHKNLLELPPVVIQVELSRQQTLQQTSATVSRDSLSWQETAGSVSTFDSNRFQTQSANRLESIINYSAGLLEGVDSAGLNTAIFARGYDSAGSTFLNGHPDIQLFYTRDLHTVDRVEILKGHSSILYGQGTPGATLHYHSKKPGPDTQRSLTATAGNYQHIRMSADLTGAIDTDASLQYRILGAWQTSDTFIDHVSNDRWFFAPSVQWEYRDNSRLLLEFAYDVDKRPFYFSTIRSHGHFRYDTSYVDSRAHSHRVYQRSAAYLDHQLSEHWQLHGVLQYAQVDRQDLLFGFLNKINEDTLKGYYRDIDDDYDQLNLQLELRGSMHGRYFQHHWMIGAEHNHTEENLISQRSWEFTLDALNPVFPDEIPPTVPLNRHIINDNQHLYINHRIHLPPAWIINYGLRFSDYKIQSDYGEGLQTASDETALSLSAAVLYKFTDTTTLYVSYSESFQPNSGRDKNNRFFKPRETQQIELGIKTSIADTFDLQLAIYHLGQSNITTTDLNNPEFETLAGKRRTRGLELEIAGPLTDQSGFKMGYSLMSAQYTHNNNGIQGNTPRSIPSHHGFLQVEWTPACLAGLKLFTGLIAVAQRWGDDDNSFRLPGYLRLDMSLLYSWQNLQFKLAANNVLDKRYISTASSESDVYQGDRRTIKSSIGYQF